MGSREHLFCEPLDLNADVDTEADAEADENANLGLDLNGIRRKKPILATAYYEECVYMLLNV